MGMLFTGLVFLVSLFLLCCFLLRWNEIRWLKMNARLPPGTMGWPLFGETTEFLKQGPLFINTQQSKYGSLFRTHILGCPTVISMDPDLNRHILLTNSDRGIIPGYPQSMLDILGQNNIAAVTGSLHRAMRTSMLSLVTPYKLLPKIDSFVRSHLSTYFFDKIIDIQHHTKEMAILSALKQIASIDPGTTAEALKTEIFQLVLGTLSLPINLPGTNYRRAFHARKRLVSMLRMIIEERRSSSSSSNNDMLDSLLHEEKLNDEQIIDLIIALVYSGYETISTTSMMAVKYLHDHPKALQELRKEHFEIRRKKLPEEAIDWNDFKSMKFTRAVIFETLRLAIVVNGVLRKTTKDIEMKGYIIPKGWRIYVYTREINYDQYLYPEPLTFNPWRWMDKNTEFHQHFMLFGGGVRLCPGKELGMAEISTFLHYFVTQYRWEEVGEDVITEFPRVQAPNGLRIKISKYVADTD